jgi:acetyl esterase/lipase
VHRAVPPFFVLHGRNDAVIPRAQARSFVDALRASWPPTSWESSMDAGKRMSADVVRHVGYAG